MYEIPRASEGSQRCYLYGISYRFIIYQNFINMPYRTEIVEYPIAKRRLLTVYINSTSWDIRKIKCWLHPMIFRLRIYVVR